MDCITGMQLELRHASSILASTDNTFPIHPMKRQAHQIAHTGDLNA
jgi:hypothetical protein